MDSPLPAGGSTDATRRPQGRRFQAGGIPGGPSGALMRSLRWKELRIWISSSKSPVPVPPGSNAGVLRANRGYRVAWPSKGMEEGSTCHLGASTVLGNDAEII